MAARIGKNDGLFKDIKYYIYLAHIVQTEIGCEQLNNR